MERLYFMAAVMIDRPLRVVLAFVFSVFLLAPLPSDAQSMAFKQAVAEAASDDDAILAFYRENGYRPIWTGKGNRDAQRRKALLAALETAGDHGLPIDRYDADLLRTSLRNVGSERDLGRLEAELSALFLTYARDIQTGVLNPRRIDEGLVRSVPYRDRSATLAAFAKSSPAAFIRKLPPQTPEYTRLMKQKMKFEVAVGKGGWGPEIRGGRKLEPGDSGERVTALRNRLIRMGYLPRNASASYDSKMTEAVRAFQSDHGLAADGVAGPATIEAVNVSMETRMTQIIVAMERERWINLDRGKRHVWVNLTDFSAAIVDDGKVTFRTRSVIGANDRDRRSPEFSDTMDHMVINPTWNVPRSIATKEYLPVLQQDPTRLSHLRLIDGAGRTVNPMTVDFTQFDANTFPFDMKQDPSRGNALGLVKFMFPNRYNIYLHDTPDKSLFQRAKRAYSHGCIRLNDPFDFAYTLLAKQVSNPESYFQNILATRKETRVDLKEPIPVHLVYRTAFTQAKGRIQFRGDVYGRDAKIWRALRDQGVVLRSVQS